MLPEICHRLFFTSQDIAREGMRRLSEGHYFCVGRICLMPSQNFRSNRLIGFGNRKMNDIRVKPTWGYRRSDVYVYVIGRVTDISPYVSRIGMPSVRVGFNCDLIEGHPIYTVFGFGSPNMIPVRYENGVLIFDPNYNPFADGYDLNQIKLGPRIVSFRSKMFRHINIRVNVEYFSSSGIAF